jgi:putative MATE family efflux protein
MKETGACNGNSLIELPIGKALFSLAIPLMVSSGLATTQSIIDTFWVGKLGKEALAAVALGGTIMMFLFALGIGIAAGTLALVARFVGANQHKTANNVAFQALIMALVMSAIVGTVGFFCSGPLLKSLGASAEVVHLGVGYLRILFAGTVTLFVLFLGSATLQGAGDTITPMKMSLLANVLNMIFDPFFIFGIGLPRMGVSGAAVATVLSQAISGALILYILARPGAAIHLNIKQLKLDVQTMKDILKIGVPNSFQMFVRSVMVLILISLVASFGNSAIAAYGIGVRLRMIFLMPAFALGSASATMVGQNLGAGEFLRARKSALFATLVDMGIMVIASILFFIFSQDIIEIFNSDPQVVRLGSEFIRVTSPFFIFIAFSAVLNKALSGAGDTLVPMFLTLLSLWFFQIPAAFLLSRHTSLGVSGIWWSIGLSSLLNGLLILAWFRTGKWKERFLKSPAKKLDFESGILLERE